VSCGADTSEDTLKTTTYPAGSFGLTGGLKFKAAGAATGSDGNIRLYFGVAILDLALTGGTINWMLIGTIFNANSESAQVFEYQLYQNGVLSTESTGSGTYTTGINSVLVQLTGQKNVFLDTLSCNLFILERFQ
jgi:hypothetical protein